MVILQRILVRNLNYKCLSLKKSPLAKVAKIIPCFLTSLSFKVLTRLNISDSDVKEDSSEDCFFRTSRAIPRDKAT